MQIAAFGMLLLAVLQAHARFGDDNFWRARRKVNCQRKCIPLGRVCDGNLHCSDGSDEEDCARCRPAAFHCDNNRCVPESARCDDYDDCWDGSDERGCDAWVRPASRPIDVPKSIKRIDTSAPIRNYSAEVSILEDFKLDIIAFKTARPDQELDAYTVIFKPMKKVAVYIHGFRTEDLIDGKEMKDALAAGADDVDCILIIDWRSGAFLNHGWVSEHWPSHIADDYELVVINNVPVVANVLADFVSTNIPRHVKIHLIGFSLGGQISGMAARTLRNNDIRTIDRISALDPAGPIFEYSLGRFTVDTTHTLRSTDADFVDVIHASSVLGMVKDAGHLDIDIIENDCYLPTCLHSKAVESYIASITRCTQITCPRGKLSLTGAQCQVQSHSELGSLGYLADLYSGRGRHMVQFFIYDYNSNKISTGSCNTFLALPLSAKDRVCRKPPTATSDCRSKPYLSVCEEPCGPDTKQMVCTERGIVFDPATGRARVPSLSGMKQRARVLDGVKWFGEKCDQPASCYGEDGERLEYFIAYKEPNSLRYFYFSREANGNVKMTPGKYSIADPRSVLSRTLLPVYEQVSPITHIFWNDDLPYGSKSLSLQNVTGGAHTDDSTSFGHSKGILAYRPTGGFLLSHSVPRFPPDPDAGPYAYPESGKKFAQMAVCVTTGTDNAVFVREMESLLIMMLTFKPQLYVSNVPHHWPISIREKFHKLVHPRQVSLGSPVTYVTKYNRASIHSYGRSRTDLYSDCFQELADTYSAPILAQTWLDRINPLPSNCRPPNTVENVNAIEIFNGVRWSQTNDHAKWIVAKPTGSPGTSPIVCVGDLNRAISTITRGGMFICFEDQQLLYLFHTNVKVVDYKRCEA